MIELSSGAGGVQSVWFTLGVCGRRQDVDVAETRARVRVARGYSVVWSWVHDHDVVRPASVPLCDAVVCGCAMN